MPEDRHFRRNLAIVAGAHFALLAGFFVFSKLNPPPKSQEVTWLDGGSSGGGEAADAEPMPEPPPPEPPPISEPPVLPPPEPPTTEDLVVPEATPKPTTPKPQTHKPSTPKHVTPKATPKVTPKATPKTSPKASVKPAGSPKPGTSGDKAKSTPGPGKNVGEAGKTGGPGAKSTGVGTGVGKGTGAGHEGGGATENQFSWYFQMLHERFHARWEQPTSIVRAGGDFVTTLKIRIGKDGSVLNREIVHSSSNGVMDESVLSAAGKVTQLDPLPKGLGNGEFFDININFKLDQE